MWVILYVSQTNDLTRNVLYTAIPAIFPVPQFYFFYGNRTPLANVLRDENYVIGPLFIYWVGEGEDGVGTIRDYYVQILSIYQKLN